MSGSELKDPQIWKLDQIHQAMSGGRDWHVFFQALETMQGQAGAPTPSFGAMALC